MSGEDTAGVIADGKGRLVTDDAGEDVAEDDGVQDALEGAGEMGKGVGTTSG